MKLLMGLLLIASCLGQKQPPTPQEKWKFKTYRDSSGYYDERNPNLTVKNFVGLWDIYAKECYADSARTGFETAWLDSLGYWHQKYDYWHPKKPTLDGFIEFLRRKTK